MHSVLNLSHHSVGAAHNKHPSIYKHITILGIFEEETTILSYFYLQSISQKSIPSMWISFLFDYKYLRYCMSTCSMIGLTRIDASLGKNKEKLRIESNIALYFLSRPLHVSFYYIPWKQALAADRRVTSPLAIVVTSAMRELLLVRIKQINVFCFYKRAGVLRTKINAFPKFWTGFF